MISVKSVECSQLHPALTKLSRTIIEISTHICSNLNAKYTRNHTLTEVKNTPLLNHILKISEQECIDDP